MIRLIAVAAAVAVIAAPNALALHAAGDDTSPAAPARTSSMLDQRDARLGPKYDVAPAATGAVPEAIRVVTPGGFAWREFLIGAASTAALALALVALVIVRRHRPALDPVAPVS